MYMLERGLITFAKLIIFIFHTFCLLPKVYLSNAN